MVKVTAHISRDVNKSITNAIIDSAIRNEVNLTFVLDESFPAFKIYGREIPFGKPVIFKGIEIRKVRSTSKKAAETYGKRTGYRPRVSVLPYVGKKDFGVEVCWHNNVVYERGQWSVSKG